MRLALGLARRHENNRQERAMAIRKLDICYGACVIETSNHFLLSSQFRSCKPGETRYLQDA